MNKYHVYLADNYDSKVPFTTEWDYELLGDKLRAEFDIYFKQKEKEAKAGAGKTKSIRRGDYVKKFMVSKGINIVEDRANDSLKSVFILRVGEKKLIDERAKNSLASRFEYKVRKDSEGNESSPMGFMKFDLVEGEEKIEQTGEKSFQVTGNDIEYFENTSQSPEEVEDVKDEEKFVCEECGKAFDTKRALHGHSLHHKKK